MIKKSFFVFLGLLIFSSVAMSNEIDDAFIKNLKTCSPYTMAVPNIKQIYGISDNKCSYFELLGNTNNTYMECHYPLSMLNSLAEYYKKNLPSLGPSIDLYKHSGQLPPNFIQQAVQKGMCKIPN